MSCWIVKPESIAKIANLISDVNYNTWSLSLPESVHYAFNYCKNSYRFFEPEKICKFLAIENYLAYDCRYKTKSEPDEIECYYLDCIEALSNNQVSAPVWENGKRTITSDHIQLFKTLQCYLYQVEDGAENNIYKSLAEFEKLYAFWIIANSDTYNSCKWE